MGRTGVIICLAVGFIGCDEAVIQPGEEGGECRVGFEACNMGLTCLDGQCQVDETDPPLPDLRVEFLIEDRYLQADGVTATLIQLQAKIAETGKPFVGDLLLYPSPSTAGRVRPGTVTFDEAGLSFAEYVSCRPNITGECPEFVFIHAAYAQTPLEPVARSAAIKLNQMNTAFESMVNEGSCTEYGGLLAFRADLMAGAEDVFSFEQSQLAVDAEAGTLTLSADGHQVRFQFDPSNMSTGRRNLPARSVHVIVADTLELAVPCGTSASALWSGYVDVTDYELVDEVLNPLNFFFEVACQGDGNRVSTLHGCAHIGVQ